MSETITKKIIEQLSAKKDKLSTLYTWEFDVDIPRKRFAISIQGESWLEKTRSLKDGLREYIRNNPGDQASAADYFIREWGGIRRFTKAKDVVCNFSELQGADTRPQDFVQNFALISSWSKWLSLICPKWACIYDARVAYSINAINYISGGDYKIFPMPEGRNTRLGILDISTLLLQKKLRGAKSSNPKDINHEHLIDRRDAYTKYLDIMNGVSEGLWGNCDHIHEVEMLLFAMADTEIYDELFQRVSKAHS